MKNLDNLRKLPPKRIVTARIDGFTERLNAIINGLYISELLKIKFYFSWNSTYMMVVGNDFHNVSASVPKIFNKSIIEDHYIPFGKWNKLHNHEECPAHCETISGKKVSNLLDIPKTENLIPCVINFPRIDYSKIILKALDPLYLKLQRDLKYLSRYTAIHYRGGDVIYGFFKDSKSAAMGTKSATLSEIEYIINEYPEENFIVFGSTSKETIKDLTFIKKKFPNTCLAADLLEYNGHPVLIDCIAMSVCKLLIGQPTSGVVRLALKLNCRLKVNSFKSMIAEEELYNLFLAGLTNPNYNYKQRIYHGIRALNFSNADKKFIAERIKNYKKKNTPWYEHVTSWYRRVSGNSY